jgi:hypothetical protein
MDGTRDVWAKRVADWRASGLDVTAFAGKHGLKEASLKWWKWQLAKERRRARKKSAKKGVALSPLTFVEMKAPSNGDALEILLANGTRIRVAPDFDPVVLSRLLDLLEKRK